MSDPEVRVRFLTDRLVEARRWACARRQPYTNGDLAFARVLHRLDTDAIRCDPAAKAQFRSRIWKELSRREIPGTELNRGTPSGGQDKLYSDPATDHLTEPQEALRQLKESLTVLRDETERAATRFQQEDAGFSVTEIGEIIKQIEAILDSASLRKLDDSRSTLREKSSIILPFHRPLIQVSQKVTVELIKRLQRTPYELKTIDRLFFEELVAELWNGFGYEIEVTKRTRDGGKDIVAIRNKIVEERFLIECKRPDIGKRIGVRPVRELYGVKTTENATKAILATTASFTKDAQVFFEKHRWELEGKDFDGLMEWLNDYILVKTG